MGKKKKKNTKKVIAGQNGNESRYVTPSDDLQS
jgi:hypothetical protein